MQPKSLVKRPSAWRVSSLRREDVSQLEKLTALIYGTMWKRAGNADYYTWKFFSEGLPKLNARVARQNDSIVGYQASYHRKFRFGDRISWSTELGDSMTHPDYRRKGMWGQITGQVIDEALGRNFLPIFGFPNPFSYRGYISKLGMSHFFDVWRLGLPLSSRAFSLNRRIPNAMCGILFTLSCIVRSVLIGIQNKFYRKMKIECDVSVHEWVDNLWAKESTRDEAGVIKDGAYFRRRFVLNPDDYSFYGARDEEGKPAGLMVTKVRVMAPKMVFGFVAETLIPCRRFDVFFRLLLEAEKDFKRKGVILVDAWTTAHPFYLRGLLAFGFLPMGKLPFILPASQAKVLRSSGWGLSKRWILTMADSDNI